MYKLLKYNHKLRLLQKGGTAVSQPPPPPPIGLGLNPVPMVAGPIIYQPAPLQDPSGDRAPSVLPGIRLRNVLEDYYWELTNTGIPLRHQIIAAMWTLAPAQRTPLFQQFLENRVNLGAVWDGLTQAQKIALTNFWLGTNNNNNGDNPTYDEMVNFRNNL